MKKFTLLMVAVALAVSSCGTQKVILQDRNILVDFVDFQQFEQQGVTISPYDCAAKEYYAVGPVSVLFVPQIATEEHAQQVADQSHNDLYSEHPAGPLLTYVVEGTDVYAAMQKMVDCVKANGGNAIFDFKQTTIPDAIDAGKGLAVNYNITVFSGYAVRLER